MTTPQAQHPGSTSEFLRHLNPATMARELWGYRDLIRQFTIREVLGRYRGSFLGFFWSFISPLLLLSVYAFVFGTLIKKKDEDPINFAMELFCGMIIFTIFSETVMRSPQLIVSNVNYVKKVVFPLEVLPAAIFGCSLIHGLISTSVLLAGLGLVMHHASWTMLYLPLVLLPLLMFCCGLAWIAAALGVFMRDLAQIVTFIIQFLMFTTPIFFRVSDFPPENRAIFNFHPLALVITDARRVLIWNGAPWWPGWLAVTAIAFVVMMLGYAWFMHSKQFFADVI